MATAEPAHSPPRPAKPILTIAILLACGAGFAASYLFGDGLDEGTLIACGASSRALVVGSRQWWRLASAGFLHADLLHLLINLYAIFALGRSVEGLWGHRRFLAIYAAALVCGNAAALAESQGTTVGATGAVFGLLGALATLLVRHRDILTRPARIRLLIGLAIVVALNIVLSIALPSIGNAEVVGGLAAGAVAATLLRPARALGRSGAPGEAFAWLAAAAAALGIIGSLTLAARHARASEWRLLIGGEMETHLLRGEELTVSVPKGWRYTPPGGRGGLHVFERPGLASVSVYLLPKAGPSDVASFASRAQQDWAKGGAELVATRELAIGDQMGVEMHFRRTAHDEVQRHRMVIFPTPGGRLACVTFACLEDRYKALEVLFDRILHSIRAGAPTDNVWEKAAGDPSNPDAAVALAARYASEGRVEPAERLLQAALRRHPSHAAAHNQLALLYATARPPYRRPAEAVLHARKAVGLKPEEPPYLATLALAHEAAGDKASALATARRAAELAPEDATYADMVKRLAK